MARAYSDDLRRKLLGGARPRPGKPGRVGLALWREPRLGVEDFCGPQAQRPSRATAVPPWPQQPTQQKSVGRTADAPCRLDAARVAGWTGKADRSSLQHLVFVDGLEADEFPAEKKSLQCAGINRHEVGNERVLRGRIRDPLGPEFCVMHREMYCEA